MKTSNCTWLVAVVFAVFLLALPATRLIVVTSGVAPDGPGIPKLQPLDGPGIPKLQALDGPGIPKLQPLDGPGIPKIIS